MKYFFLSFLIVIVAVLAIGGLRGTEFRRFSQPPFEVFPDMDRQPKYKAQNESSFFADGRSDRTPVAQTVPFDAPLQSTYLASGKIGNNWGDGIPVKVDAALLARGQERYTISCAICHGATGAGNGVTAKFGLVGIANLQQSNFTQMEDGHIFYTITHGKGQMGSYSQIKVEDRWAIVSYVRALQRAQNGKLSELPEAVQAGLK